MNFEHVVISGGIGLIAAIVVTQFLSNPTAAKEPDTTLTRLEQQYFEPEVAEAQQAEVELERQRQNASYMCRSHHVALENSRFPKREKRT